MMCCLVRLLLTSSIKPLSRWLLRKGFLCEDQVKHGHPSQENEASIQIHF